MKGNDILMHEYSFLMFRSNDQILMDTHIIFPIIYMEECTGGVH